MTAIKTIAATPEPDSRRQMAAKAIAVEKRRVIDQPCHVIGRQPQPNRRGPNHGSLVRRFTASWCRCCRSSRSAAGPRVG